MSDQESCLEEAVEVPRHFPFPTLYKPNRAEKWSKLKQTKMQRTFAFDIYHNLRASQLFRLHLRTQFPANNPSLDAKYGNRHLIGASLKHSPYFCADWPAIRLTNPNDLPPENVWSTKICAQHSFL